MLIEWTLCSHHPQENKQGLEWQPPRQAARDPEGERGGPRGPEGAGGEGRAADLKRGVPGDGLGAGPEWRRADPGRLRFLAVGRGGRGCGGFWRSCVGPRPADLSALATGHCASGLSWTRKRLLLEGRDGDTVGAEEGLGAAPVILSSSLGRVAASELGVFSVATAWPVSLLHKGASGPQI